MEPEKSSPVLPAGVKPFQPRRRVEVYIDEEKEERDDTDELITTPST